MRAEAPRSEKRRAQASKSTPAAASKVEEREEREEAVEAVEAVEREEREAGSVCPRVRCPSAPGPDRVRPPPCVF